MRVRQWNELSVWERRVLIHSAMALPVWHVMLRLMPFVRLKRRCESVNPVSGGRSGSPENRVFALRCAELVAVAARHEVFFQNCLTQSVVLCRLLRRNGLKAYLRVGVHTDTSDFRAHAWVELEGENIGALPNYSPFDHDGRNCHL